MTPELPTLLVEAGATAIERNFAYEREAQLWAVLWQDVEAVIRRLTPVALFPSDEKAVVASRTWSHTYLSQAAETGFPVPRPLPMFDGSSVAIADGYVWEALSYVPGEPVAWSDQPGMDQVGAVLASFHEATKNVRMRAQRPGACPLGEVPEVLLAAPWSGLTSDRESIDQLIELAAALRLELASVNLGSIPTAAAHGDPTTLNVLAEGHPPGLSGLIDFGGAYIENAVADIGFSLWQSGRPQLDARTLDLLRVTAFVEGYTSVRPLPDGASRAIPVFIMARGLQMMAKRARSGVVALGNLELVGWVYAHLHELERTIAGALR